MAELDLAPERLVDHDEPMNSSVIARPIVILTMCCFRISLPR
jgi:hypothetical protein